MIHVCNIHCHVLDIEKAELMGLEDRGQWMSFAFHLDVVVACKLTSLEEDSLVYNCTTIFTEHGDTYIIDTPYKTFQKMFVDYHSPVKMLPPTDEESSTSEDLDF
mgnify:FL=1|jgi:hypothetical protein